MSVLRDNPIFAPASPDALADLERASFLRQVPTGEAVLFDDIPSEHLYALCRGAVRVFHVSPSGAEVVVKLFRAPAVFGEAGALGGLSPPGAVNATEDCELLVIPVRALVRFLVAQPYCAVRLLIDVSARLAIATYSEKSLAFNPVTIRLANYLLDYISWKHGESDAEALVDLTQEAMAAAIGATRRSVAKDIAAWQREGLLRRSGEHYIVIDREALQRYSDPDRLTLAYRLLEERFAQFGGG